MFVPPEQMIRRLRENNKKQSDEIKQLQERIKILEQENSSCELVYDKEITRSKAEESALVNQVYKEGTIQYAILEASNFWGQKKVKICDCH